MSKIIRIRLGEQLQKENRSRYWLMKEANITIHCINKLIKNEASAIYFETLERICDALDCNPADLVEWDKDKRSKETNE